MFYKGISWDHSNDGNAETGPIPPNEEIWCVCRANSFDEAKVLLKIFMEYTNTQKKIKIREATEEEYDEYIQFIKEEYYL